MDPRRGGDAPEGPRVSPSPSPPHRAPRAPTESAPSSTLTPRGWCVPGNSATSGQRSPSFCRGAPTTRSKTTGTPSQCTPITPHPCPCRSSRAPRGQPADPLRAMNCSLRKRAQSWHDEDPTGGTSAGSSGTDADDEGGSRKRKDTAALKDMTNGRGRSQKSTASKKQSELPPSPAPSQPENTPRRSYLSWCNEPIFMRTAR